MKSRIQSILLACFALTGAFLASCSDDTLLNSPPNTVTNLLR